MNSIFSKWLLIQLNFLTFPKVAAQVAFQTIRIWHNEEDKTRSYTGIEENTGVIEKAKEDLQWASVPIKVTWTPRIRWKRKLHAVTFSGLTNQRR